jgi:hypothetical protein
MSGLGSATFGGTRSATVAVQITGDKVAESVFGKLSEEGPQLLSWMARRQ